MSELTKGEVEDFIQQAYTGVLAWISSSGEPRSVPISYLYENGCIWFTTAARSYKVAAIRRQPLVSFSIPCEPTVRPPRAVTIRGRAEIGDYDEDRHMRMYVHYGFPRDQALQMRVNLAQTWRLVSISVRPTRVMTFGFGTAEEEALTARRLGKTPVV